MLLLKDIEMRAVKQTLSVSERMAQMKTGFISSIQVNPGTAVLILFAAGFALIYLRGWQVPLVSNDRTAMLIFLMLGMAICSQGIGRVASSGQWLHPLSIAGYLLGALILTIGISSLIGKNNLFFENSRQGYAAVAIMAVAKVLVSTIHRFLV